MERKVNLRKRPPRLGTAETEDTSAVFPRMLSNVDHVLLHGLLTARHPQVTTTNLQDFQIGRIGNAYRYDLDHGARASEIQDRSRYPGYGSQLVECNVCDIIGEYGKIYRKSCTHNPIG